MATKVKLSKINEIATNVKTNVDKNHALPKRKDYDWAEYGYLLARAVVYPKQDITPMKVSKAPSPKGNHISRQIKKVDYIHLAKKVISFAKKYGRLPNFVSWGNYKIRAKLYIYSFARIVVYTALKGKQPTYVNCNAKAFDKPSEPVNEVFAYFCKVFGINPTCIDDCLERVEGNGYGYYYDDVYSNKTSIDRMKKGYGVNCVSRIGADLKSHDALQIKRQDAPQLLEQLFRQRLVAEWQAEGKGKAAIIFSHNYKVETIIAAIKRFQKKQEENL